MKGKSSKPLQRSPAARPHASARAIARLTQLAQTLKQRTREVTESNRRMKQEIVRRIAAEKSLLKSRKHQELLLEQTQLMHEQMRRLSRRALLAQENERKRISRDLHDVIAQILTGINVRLAALKREASTSTAGLGRKISSAQRLVEKSVEIVHEFARELRPAVLDDLGFIPALHSHLKQFMRETGVHVRLLACSEVGQLSNLKRTVLYRVALEALGNIARHAGASRADVKVVKLPEGIRMEIRDNGKGFDVERILHTRKGRHLGLLGMRERAEMVGGKFTIKSARARGTTIAVTLPLRHAAKEKPKQ